MFSQLSNQEIFDALLVQIDVIKKELGISLSEENDDLNSENESAPSSALSTPMNSPSRSRYSNSNASSSQASPEKQEEGNLEKLPSLIDLENICQEIKTRLENKTWKDISDESLKESDFKAVSNSLREILNKVPNCDDSVASIKDKIKEVFLDKSLNANNLGNSNNLNLGGIDALLHNLLCFNKQKFPSSSLRTVLFTSSDNLDVSKEEEELSSKASNGRVSPEERKDSGAVVPFEEIADINKAPNEFQENPFLGSKLWSVSNTEKIEPGEPPFKIPRIEYSEYIENNKGSTPSVEENKDGELPSKAAKFG